MKAFATFTHGYNGTTESYRIRFNSVASVLLKDVNWAFLSKTGDYIIVAPYRWQENGTFGIYHDNHNCAWLSANTIVKQNGSLSKSLFGKRYKVKRDKKGNVYICLNEEVPNDR